MKPSSLSRALVGDARSDGMSTATTASRTTTFFRLHKNDRERVALRWKEAGMLEAKRGSLRIKTYRQLPPLKDALTAHRGSGTDRYAQVA